VSEEFEMQVPVYRVPRPRGALDGSTGRLMLIAAGLGGTLLVVLGLSLVGGHHRGAIPVIEAEAGPVRVKPDNPGGMSIAGSEDEILSSSAGDDSGKLAPAAEAPALQALREQEQAETARAAAPRSAAVTPPTAPGTAPAAAVALAAPAPAVTRAAASPVPAALDRKPAAHPVLLAAAHAAESRPAESRPAGHATDVQLGAVDSEAAAQQEWARLTRKAPELLGTRRPAFSPAARGGQTFWRLRTGGFASVAEATTFCERARAKHLPCDIAAF
jgi:hypothetical protein